MTKGIDIVNRTLRIAQVAPPFERVPPHAYGGTERVVDELVRELHRRGHHVTTFASGDSIVPGERVVTVPEALRPLGYAGDSLPYMHITMQQVLARASEFDVIHAHLEWASLLLARVSPVPVVTTFHGRLDLPWAEALLTDPPGGLVAISQNQASTHPDVPWAAVVYNGLTLGGAPTGRRRGDGLVFVGRITPEKGIVEAIEIATRTGRPLKIAAKAGPSAKEREYHDDVFLPALKAAGSLAEYVGEIAGPERDLLFAESYATLMPGSWPEPFGLVAIESLACGTPVVARRIGALPEVLREGIDGFFGDDVTGMAFVVDRVAELDREAIRTSVVDRFSAQRMTDGYEAVYRRMIAGESRGADDRETGGTGAADDAQELELASPDRLADHRPDRLEALTGGR